MDSRYEKTTCVDPVILIREVKKYELIYNKQHPSYSDMSQKEQIWEEIHCVLFPQYINLSDETRAVIRKTVRKRWKSLRDGMVKELRFQTEMPNYKRKKRNHLLQELDFIIPYVKKPKTNGSAKSEDESNASGMCNSIDLTSEFDDEETSDSPIYCPPRSANGSEDNSDVEIEVPPLPPLRKPARLATSPVPEAPSTYAFKLFPDCPSSPLKPEMVVETEMKCPTNDSSPVFRNGKRRRLSTRDYIDKLFGLIERMHEREEEDANDEDRLFLLSLLADFKQVRPHKKLRVKSAILGAISNGQI